LVEAPGIPESTVTIIEKTSWKHKCEKLTITEPMGQYKDFADCVAKNSDKDDPRAYCGSIKAQTENNSINTSKEQFKVLTDNSKTEEPAKADTSKEMDHECPEGQVMKDGKCVPAGEKKSEVKQKEDCGCSKTEKPVERQPDSTWVAGIDEINSRMKELKEMMSSAKEIINKTTDSELKRLDGIITADKIMQSNQIARIAPDPDGFKNADIKVLAEALVPSLRKYGHFAWTIDLTPDYVQKAYGKVTEAITFTNDQSNITNAMTDVFVLPGGKYIKPIRQLTRFKEIPQGAASVNFFKGDIPNQQNYAEGTAITASTHVLTTINLAADTVQGIGQVIKQADIEDTPAELMSYLNQTARAETLEAEATLVFDTAWKTASANLWINANTGATLSGGDDVAGMTMEPVALRVALQDLEDSGYDTSFGNDYCALRPKALRELRGSTNLTDYVQNGDATLTKTGALTHLYGIELIPTSAVAAMDNTTNDTFRNQVGIKGHSIALASHRELLIDILKQPLKSAYDWAWSQRKNAVAFDLASTIKISSAQ